MNVNSSSLRMAAVVALVVLVALLLMVSGWGADKEQVCVPLHPAQRTLMAVTARCQLACANPLQRAGS